MNYIDMELTVDIDLVNPADTFKAHVLDSNSPLQVRGHAGHVIPKIRM